VASGDGGTCIYFTEIFTDGNFMRFAVTEHIL
jgi:hypothetical protein